MDHIKLPPMRAYDATGYFLSGIECFAMETLAFEVVRGLEPYEVANAYFEHSHFANEQVPDLSIAVSLVPIDISDVRLDGTIGVIG